MANVFKLAKKVQKQHPRLTWQQAIKKAAKKNKVGTVKKKKEPFRQTGKSNVWNDSMRKAKTPGKRKSASGKTYYERRRNRSDNPETLSGFKDVVKKHLAKALYDYEMAQTVKATKAARARVVKYRKILKSI